MSISSVSRRNFVSGGAVCALGAGMVAGASAARADEATGEAVAALADVVVGVATAR